ncbi:MAG: hypothetical protein ACR2QX_11340 [Woeseiaceae bacterium]
MSVVAAALSACAIEPELLNSERIEEQFGGYGIEVLSSEPGLRRSALFSNENGVHTCRTYAVVRFVEKPDAIIGPEHAQILAGNSIGAIFKAKGWAIHKETLHIGSAGSDADNSHLTSLMRLQPGREVAMHVYRLLLQKEGQAIDYATIIELHHPEYLSQQDLRDMYPVDAETALAPQQVRELKTLSLVAA